MILGIGVDTATVARVAKSMQGEGFAQRVYSEGELALFASLGEKHAAESAAANFAAKEAFLKAVGSGLGGFALAEIAVLRRENGQPFFALAGKAAAWQKGSGAACHLSLTHEGGLATAFVVLETAGPTVRML